MSQYQPPWGQQQNQQQPGGYQQTPGYPMQPPAVHPGQPQQPNGFARPPVQTALAPPSSGFQQQQPARPAGQGAYQAPPQQQQQQPPGMTQAYRPQQPPQGAYQAPPPLQQQPGQPRPTSTFPPPQQQQQQYHHQQQQQPFAARPPPSTASAPPAFRPQSAPQQPQQQQYMQPQIRPQGPPAQQTGMVPPQQRQPLQQQPQPGGGGGGGYPQQPVPQTPQQPRPAASSFGMRPPTLQQPQPQPGYGNGMPPPSTPASMMMPRPPGMATPAPQMPPPQQQQQQQQPGGGFGMATPAGVRPPAFGAAPPAMRPPGTLQQQQPQQQQQPPQMMMGGGIGAPPPMMGGPRPPMMMAAPGIGGGGGMGGGGGGYPAPPPQQQQQYSHQYDGSAGMHAAVMDAFESLSLGGGPAVGGGGIGGPGIPGQQQQPGVGGQPNPAAFPRPAGNAASKEAALGPPPQPYSTSNCKPEFMRPTTHAVPSSAALKTRWHLPYGAIVHPLSDRGSEVPVANAGNTTIIRCKRCRTYMNPFMTWADGGRRFNCNVCALSNEVPVEYFSPLDGSGRRVDADQRPELSTGSVEYVAPAEYMVRAPMPPTYVFLIDVSFAAAASGMLGIACHAIKSCLNGLPGGERTQIAVITYDKSLHFYNLRAGQAAPQMMVVAETEDPFIPLPDDLLVNLHECRSLVDMLLDSIPQMFGRNNIVDSATGPALQAAFLLMNHVGGKLMLFQSAAPSVGIGRIKSRDNAALYGTDKEPSLRNPDDPFYKRYSAEASRFQICLDIFATGASYMDLPSLGALAKYTGGQLYHYPGFAAERDGVKLQSEIVRNLTRELAWEAVMRIRCSKGLRISVFHGHFFIRSTDLLALPCCDADKAFAVEICHEETMVTGQVAYIQAALLYTSSAGERRIRVHTMALPIVSDLLDMYKGTDLGATMALFTKSCVERSMSTKLDDVRARAQQRVAATLREYRMLHMRGGFGGGQPSPNSLLLPERMKSLPIMTLGLLKTAAFRGTGRDVNADERATAMHAIASGPVEEILSMMYPACYPVHDPSADGGAWGQPGAGPDGRRIQLPSTVPAGLEYFDPSGVYLIDNGKVVICWLGNATPATFYNTVFGVQDGGGATARDASQLKLEPARQGSELSDRINNVLNELRARKEVCQECYVVKQGSPMEAHVMPFFIEDRLQAVGALGYLDWMVQLQKQVMSMK